MLDAEGKGEENSELRALSLLWFRLERFPDSIVTLRIRKEFHAIHFGKHPQMYSPSSDPEGESRASHPPARSETVLLTSHDCGIQPGSFREFGDHPFGRRKVLPKTGGTELRFRGSKIERPERRGSDASLLCTVRDPRHLRFDFLRVQEVIGVEPLNVGPLCQAYALLRAAQAPWFSCATTFTWADSNRRITSRV
jgi:hypothetical protein